VKDAVSRTDPTGTGKIRSGFEGEVVRRMRKLRALTRHAIVDLDVLGLKPTGSINSAMFKRVFQGQGPGRPPREPHGVALGGHADRAHAFIDWFKGAQAEVVIAAPGGPRSRTTTRAMWFYDYIDRGYRKGREDASKNHRRVKDGVADAEPRFRAGFGPASQERVDLIAARSFTDLEGINEATSQRISRSLTQGLQEGLSPEAIARGMARDIDEIGITRARTLARTEVIGAHAEGALDEYTAAGVEGVEVQAEFSTAGDEQVCPECEDLEGNVYSIDEARGIIPVHPNCRCAWLPIVGDEATQTVEPERSVPPIVAEGLDSEVEAKFRGYVDEMSDKVLAKLVEGGQTFRFGNTVTQLYPELKGVTPRGWPRGSTWDEAEGLHKGSRKEIATTRYFKKRNGELVETKRARGVVYHETGHGFDQSHGYISHSEAFRRAYAEDIKKIKGRDLRKDLKYYLQKGDAGPSEAFAEVFAWETGNTGAGWWTDIRKYFPETTKFMKGLLT